MASIEMELMMMILMTVFLLEMLLLMLVVWDTTSNLSRAIAVRLKVEI